MDTNIAQAYTDFFAAKAKIDEYTKIMEAAKAAIKKHHLTTKQQLIVEGDIKSHLIPSVKTTPNIKGIEAKFGIKLPREGEDGYTDCYKVTHYDQLRVEKIILEATK